MRCALHPINEGFHLAVAPTIPITIPVRDGTGVAATLRQGATRAMAQAVTPAGSIVRQRHVLFRPLLRRKVQHVDQLADGRRVDVGLYREGEGTP